MSLDVPRQTGTASASESGMRNEALASRVDVSDTLLTVEEVAERLKVNAETVRRLFMNEPGVIVLWFPRKGKRVYRTLRVPEHIYERVLTRFVRVA